MLKVSIQTQALYVQKESKIFMESVSGSSEPQQSQAVKHSKPTTSGKQKVHQDPSNDTPKYVKESMLM